MLAMERKKDIMIVNGQEEGSLWELDYSVFCLVDTQTYT